MPMAAQVADGLSGTSRPSLRPLPAWSNDSPKSYLTTSRHRRRLSVFEVEQVSTTPFTDLSFVPANSALQNAPGVT